MNEVVYDVPICEVAKVLEKSDRQVRRYVKSERLKAKPIRIDGHIKLMFNRDEVLMLKKGIPDEGVFGQSGREILVDARLVEDGGNRVTRKKTAVEDDADAVESNAVKYVIDALREQIKELQTENKDIHYQLEKRSGQVGFLQGKVETLEEEMRMLMPATPSQDEIIVRKPWYKRMFGRE